MKKDIFFSPSVEEENFARLVSSLFLFPLRHALSPPATLNLKARRRKKSSFFPPKKLPGRTNSDPFLSQR